MRVTIINPIEEHKRDLMPVELLVVASELIEGNNVRFIDQNRNPGINLTEIIQKDYSEAVFIWSRTIKQCARSLAIASEVKEKSDALVIGMGELRRVPELACSMGFDVIIKNEPELTSKLILETVKDRSELCKVPNITTRKFQTQSKRITRDIDRLSFPAYNLVDFEYYVHALDSPPKELEQILRSSRRVPIYASIGCPYSCTFCTNRKTTHLRHSVGYIIDHIRFLVDKHKITFIDFEDPCFNSSESWVYDFTSALKNLDKPLRYRIYGARSDLVSESMLEHLSETGCVSIYFGFESGDQRMLDLMQKGMTVEQNIRAIMYAQKLGIYAPVQLITGHSCETQESIDQTMRVIKNKGIPFEDLKVREIMPIPGTPIFEEFTRDGKITDVMKYLMQISKTDSRNNWRLDR